MFERLIDILKANPRKIVFTEGPDARIHPDPRRQC